MCKYFKKLLSMCLVIFFMCLTLVTVGAPKANAAVSGFVTRNGWQLMLNGNVFRFTGTNMHWLSMDESAGNGPEITPDFRIDDGFKACKEMGVTVVRSFMLLNLGSDITNQPYLGEFNETALKKVDYAIKVAGDNGIRLILPLIDRFHFATGGRHNYVEWRGIRGEYEFYTNPVLIDDFKQYISKILNRVNTYTGVAYKNDPTILAWETGNELESDVTSDPHPPISWLEKISNYIKSIDTNHLVADGSYGINTEALYLPNVDMYSDHDYGMNTSRDNNNATLCKNANKVYFVGEYDWVNKYGGDSLSTYLSNIESNTAISGDLFWELFPHRETYGFDTHSEGFAAHYPVGDGIVAQDKPQRLQTLRTHSYTMAGLATPAHSIPLPPVITDVANGSGTSRVLKWQGAAIAYNYTIERSTQGSNGPWTVIADQNVNDFSTPWTDSTAPSGTLWYRIKPYNYAGVAGNYSNVYMHDPSAPPTPTPTPTPAPTPAPPPVGTLIDEMNDFSKMYAYSSNLMFDTTQPVQFRNDPSRLIRTSAGNEYIIYNTNYDTNYFFIDMHFWQGEPVIHNKIYTSPDNITYTEITPTILRSDTVTAVGRTWTEYFYMSSSLPAGTRYLKIVFNNTSVNAWNPHIGRVKISYDDPFAPPTPMPAPRVLVDELKDFSKIYSRTGNLTFDGASPNYFNGDNSRLERTSSGYENIVYRTAGDMTYFMIDSFFWPGEQVTHNYLYTSPDGNTFTQLTPTITNLGGNYWRYKYECAKRSLSVLTGESPD